MDAPAPERRLTVAESMWMATRGPAGAVQVWRLLVVWDDRRGELELFAHFGASPGARPLPLHKGSQRRLVVTADPAYLATQIDVALGRIAGKGYTPRPAHSAPDAFYAGAGERLIQTWIDGGRAHFAPPPLGGQATRPARSLAEALGSRRAAR